MKDAFKCNVKLTVYCILLMTAFNSLSHGSQDLYPTFLETEKHLFKGDRVVTVVISQIGALVGGIASGFWSQRIGRRKSIIICCLLVLAFIYPWSFGDNLPILRMGAFFLQYVIKQVFKYMP